MEDSWKIANILTLLKNSLLAILRGEFIFKLKVGRYFVHILYTFFLFALIIWFSLAMEATMARVEKNKKELEELEIIHSQKTFEVVSMSRRSTVRKMLENMGSEVGEPGKPATALVK